MGNVFCLNKKVDDSFDSIRRISPAPSLKKRKDVLIVDQSTLQEACVEASARGIVAGSLDVKTLSLLPLELLQRVLDHIIAKGW